MADGTVDRDKIMAKYKKEIEVRTYAALFVVL